MVLCPARKGDSCWGDVEALREKVVAMSPVRGGRLGLSCWVQDVVMIGTLWAYGVLAPSEGCRHAAGGRRLRRVNMNEFRTARSGACRRAAQAGLSGAGRWQQTVQGDLAG